MQIIKHFFRKLCEKKILLNGSINKQQQQHKRKNTHEVKKCDEKWDHMCTMSEGCGKGGDNFHVSTLYVTQYKII
jgi:hypothetical protein